MQTLTIEQQAIINSPEAMRIICEEAMKTLASAYGPTLNEVALVLGQGNTKLAGEYARLVTLGVNTASKLAK
ncbi:hypothetical protein [Vibrio breoganii]|uniref:hypothetical protein n=1 Tax=Vibrio breoganii TaxID=553239 RepID=UPI0003113223|nr:hypothetical protein [Vibrio breoganii]OEF87665.1 hypothetical protein B003_14800 [Vibrio breoganii 1C10]